MYSELQDIINIRLLNELPSFNMNDIPPLPAFDNQAEMELEQAQTFLPDRSVLFYSGMFIFALIIVIIGIVLKFKKKSPVYSKTIFNNSIKSKKNKKTKKTYTIAQAKAKETVSGGKYSSYPTSAIQKQNENSTEILPVDNEEYKLKLGTPKNLQSCIKIFLEKTI